MKIVKYQRNQRSMYSSGKKVARYYMDNIFGVDIITIKHIISIDYQTL